MSVVGEVQKPKISLCVTCMDRADQLRNTFKQNLIDLSSFTPEELEIVLVLFCHPKKKEENEKIDLWVRKTFPRFIRSGLLKYYITDRLGSWHASIAKNTSHRLASGDFLLNMDCDNKIDTREIYFLLDELKRAATGESERFIYHGWTGKFHDGTYGRIGLLREDFEVLGGYDESFLPMGSQDMDLLTRAHQYFPSRIKLSAKHESEAISNSKEESMKNIVLNFVDKEEKRLEEKSKDKGKKKKGDEEKKVEGKGKKDKKDAKKITVDKNTEEGIDFSQWKPDEIRTETAEPVQIKVEYPSPPKLTSNNNAVIPPLVIPPRNNNYSLESTFDPEPVVTSYGGMGGEVGGGVGGGIGGGIGETGGVGGRGDGGKDNSVETDTQSDWEKINSLLSDTQDQIRRVDTMFQQRFDVLHSVQELEPSVFEYRLTSLEPEGGVGPGGEGGEEGEDLGLSGPEGEEGDGELRRAEGDIKLRVNSILHYHPPSNNYEKKNLIKLKTGNFSKVDAWKTMEGINRRRIYQKIKDEDFLLIPAHEGVSVLAIDDSYSSWTHSKIVKTLAEYLKDYQKLYPKILLK